MNKIGFKDFRGDYGVMYGCGNYPISHSTAATNVSLVFNTSATMPRQGGRVQPEQSNMHLALNVAKMAKEGFSCAAIKETHQLIENPCAEVQEEKQRGVEFSGHKQVKAVIERHPAMIRENQTDCCLPWQNGVAKNPQAHWRRKGTGAPPPRPAPPRPETPPAPPGDSKPNQSNEIVCAPPGYVYIRSPLPNTEFLDHDAYAKDHKRDIDFIPGLLTDQGPSTG